MSNSTEAIKASKDFVSAPCSRFEMSKADEVIPDFTSDQDTKFYAVYKYQNKKLVACDEYSIWSSWNVQNAKAICEKDKKFSCLVQAATKCSTQGATTICEKKPEKPNQTYRHVEYAVLGQFLGFNFEQQCKQSFNSLASGKVETGDTNNLQNISLTKVPARMVADVSTILSTARLVPNRNNNDIQGFKILDLTPTNFFAILGIQKDDIILLINGKVINDSKNLFESFKNLEKNSGIIIVKRKEKELRFQYVIE